MQVIVNRASNGQFKRKYFVDESYFETLGHEQAWLIGFLAADGNVYGNYLRLSQSGKGGRRLIDVVKDMLQYTGRIYTDKSRRAHLLVISSKVLIESLRPYGIVARKSLVYEFPKDVLPTKFHPAFIRGYVEGDGCAGIYWYGNTYALQISFVGTEQFIDVCHEIIPVHGIRTKIERSTNCVELRFVGQKAVEFGYWIWKDKALPLTQKRAIWWDFVTRHQPRYLAYAGVKAQVMKLLDNKVSVSEIVSVVDLPFQTLYKWKHLYESERLLSKIMLDLVDCLGREVV